jgi:hypothetical protein
MAEETELSLPFTYSDRRLATALRGCQTRLFSAAIGMSRLKPMDAIDR